MTEALLTLVHYRDAPGRVLPAAAQGRKRDFFSRGRAEGDLYRQPPVVRKSVKVKAST